MTIDADPERAALRKFLLELAPRFVDEESPDHTDAERRAITKLINCGLIEAEYTLEIVEQARQRAATAIIRLSKSAAVLPWTKPQAAATTGSLVNHGQLAAGLMWAQVGLDPGPGGGWIHSTA